MTDSSQSINIYLFFQFSVVRSKSGITSASVCQITSVTTEKSTAMNSLKLNSLEQKIEAVKSILLYLNFEKEIERERELNLSCT